MRKVLFIGTDIHGEEKESVIKQINILREGLKDSGVLSLLREKSRTNDKNTYFVPKVWPRKLFQGLLLPFYLWGLSKEYEIFHFFWTASSWYHRFIIKLCKFFNKKVIFTVISGYDKDYNLIKDSDLVIVQSPRMKEHLKKYGVKSELIYPGVDLNKFKTNWKSRTILFAGMPYRNYLLRSRCVFELLLGFKKAWEKADLGINLILVFRGGETEKTVREFINKNNIKNVGIINNYVNDIYEVMNRSMIVTNIYRDIIPDMPLSGVEGVSSGCVLITTKGSALADLVRKNNAGVIVEDNEESISKGITEALRNFNKLSKNALKLRDVFDKNRFRREYLKIYEMI